MISFLKPSQMFVTQFVQLGAPLSVRLVTARFPTTWLMRVTLISSLVIVHQVGGISSIKQSPFFTDCAQIALIVLLQTKQNLNMHLQL